MSQIPSHILAWKKSSEVVRMEQILVGDPRRTVQGFEADPLFHAPAPRIDYNDPYEQDEDRLKKVTRYWAARDVEREQRTHRYDELLAAEMQASILRCEAEQAAKEGMAGPSGKGKEAPKMPRRTPRKAANVPLSDSKEEKEDGDEAPPSCVECLRKRIVCVPQPGKKRSCMACYKHKIRCDFLDKTVWAVLEGSRRMAESVRELAGMEKRREYFRLELKWYELQRYSFDLQRTGELDAAAADFRLLQMLHLRGQGLDIPEDLEERFRTERLNIEMRVRERVDTVEKCMDEVRREGGFILPSGESANSPTLSGKRKANDEEEEETEGEIEECMVRTKRRKVFSDEE
ncbi:hypothetical protein M422DRAFT_270995 [Sphaerobolus stellatus SS14]|uniref:Unplaced genomic scaffold SPHSTscaffold_248, whole genome shotgun sequence n=1 Tax=Sphaerobolus stellatus (strain SS14) TaxID=990650 RepID=A0A0C9URA6_SPHS4|nr:hypothetical protein M422DRAFT_270995 [Sphaerobolus stellatus SS14]